MAEQRWMTKTVYFPAFVSACCVVGWMIPTFYDWSGADQSHSTPAMDQMQWCLIAFGCLAWFVIPWLPMEDAPHDDVCSENTDRQGAPKPFQFNLKGVLTITTVLAISFVGLGQKPVGICILIWVVAFVSAVSMVVKHLGWKWQFSALLASMYLPFVWLFASSVHKNLGWEFVVGALGLPAFIPAMYFGSLLDTRTVDQLWLWWLLTSIEMAIGFCLIQIGRKWTIAYFVLVMLMSLYGSLFLNMGMRI